jgi:hypothetical protein
VEETHAGYRDKQAYLGKVQGGGLATVVVVAVHVEDLLALNGEETREDALSEAGTKDDDVVFFVLCMARSQ